MLARWNSHGAEHHVGPFDVSWLPIDGRGPIWIIRIGQDKVAVLLSILINNDMFRSIGDKMTR